MPTLPSEPHRARQVAESFGTDPDRYDRTRPRYPDTLVQAIIAAGPGRDVLDVGCGTGIVARQLQAAGCRVLGVDADARMAEFARRHGVDVEVARFEDWPAAGRVFDVVVAGQTWHWVDPVAGAAKAAEVLRPGGRLAVFWNVAQTPPSVAEAFAAVYRRVMPDRPAGLWSTPALDVYSSMFTRASTGIRDTAGFDEPHQWRFDWEQTYTRDEWLDQVSTHGGNNQLPASVRDDLLTGLGAAIDDVGGTLVMPYATVAVTARRTA